MLMKRSVSVGATIKGLPWRRLAAIFVTAIAAVSISFFAGWSARDLKRLPALVRTLDGVERDFDSGLNARIRQLFPAGSSEDDLIGYLDAEGFVPEWRARNGPNAGRFVHDGMLCKKIARVLWRSDERGKLISVSGSYASRCATDPPQP
jgi:hypothetical protein